MILHVYQATMVNARSPTNNGVTFCNKTLKSSTTSPPVGLFQDYGELKYSYDVTDSKEDSKYAINSSLVNRRGIYKDVVGSGPGREYSDYQLRPNFPVAMVRPL